MARKKTKDECKLFIDQPNGWLQLKAAERKKVMTFCEDYRVFMSEVKTERQAHDRGIELARKNGYEDLHARMASGQQLKPGDRVYYGAAGKTLLLAHIGTRPIEDGCRIIGGHTDSPRLDLKPRPLYEDGNMVLLDTHYYGGIRKYQWVAMPLAMHGVVITREGKCISVSLGDQPDEPVLVISDLLPHLAKDQAGKKLSEAIPGEGLNVLFSSMPTNEKEAKAPLKQYALELLQKKYGIQEEDLLSAELEIVPAGAARDLGMDRSMLLAYGHDDRVCAYTAMRAMLDLKKTPEYTSICILCDKEEIGSVGSTGMDSFLFENVMAELVNLLATPYSELILRRSLRNSKMLSADVNAIHDPNFPEVSSPNENMARMNQGLIVTKYGGARGKSGSNDASAEYMAELRKIFDAAKVIWQPGELGKVDQGGGGTIAYMLARYEMDVVDCGVGLLAMHAPWEVAGKLDIYMAWKGYHAFYNWK